MAISRPLSATSNGLAPVHDAVALTFAEIVITVHGASVKDAVHNHEVFGPVVTVIPYVREAEAVAIANAAGPGLAGTVWTSDPDHGVDIARRIHVGTFGVNLYVPDLGSPWGGKAGGQGSTYGPECLGAYLRPKSVFLPEPYPSPA